MPGNSDAAVFLLEAQSMLHGNIFLKGWWLPPDTFWPLIPVLFATAVHGVSQHMLVYVPAFLYSAIVMVSLILVKRNQSLKTCYVNLTATFAIIGTPILSFVAVFDFPTGRHVAIFYFLLAFVLLEQVKEISKKYWMYIGGTFLLLVLAVLGDPFSYVIILSMFIVYFLGLPISANKQKNIFFICLILSAVISSVIVQHVIQIEKGFYVNPTNNSFVNFDDLTTNINHTVHSMFSLFGADFFGINLASTAVLIPLLRLPLLLLVLYVLYDQMKSWRKSQDVISQVMTLAILFSLLACVFSTQMAHIDGNGKYMMPLIMFGGVLVGRNLNLKNKFHIYILLIFFGFSFLFSFNQIRYQHVSVKKFPDVESWLEENNYTKGYAGYWESHIITVETKNKVIIRPISLDGSYLAPFAWLANKNWYVDSEKANFVILKADDWGVNLASALKTFGTPDQVKKIDDVTILIWNKNITNDLISRSKKTT